MKDYKTKRLEELDDKFFNDAVGLITNEEIKDFLSQTIDQVREEEKERIRKNYLLIIRQR